MKYLRPAALLLALAVAAQARAADPALVAKGRAYVESDQVSKNVLGMMHLGATYKGCEPIETFKVTAGGQELPGAFGVSVRIYWAFNAGDNDHTDVDYYFNAGGRFLKLTPASTTGIFSQPFLASGLAVEVLKQAMLDNLKGKPDEKTLAPIIKAADAKRLTEIALQLNQP